MDREELNEIYKKLESKMHKIVAPFTSIHKGFEFAYGYYSGHYHKASDGKYVMDYFPIPVITLEGLCDIEIDLDSKEKEIGFSFMFSGDVDAEEIYLIVKFLRKEGFYY